MNSEIILQCRDLEKTYSSSSENLTIFKNLNLDVCRGEKLVIIGKSGSGKSTLLNIIGGLDSASSGSVVFEGKDITSMSEKDLTLFRKKSLGLIFQFHYLLKDFTALENIYLPAYMAGVPKKEAVEKAMSLIEKVGLADRASHIPSQMSGGERQRIAVARSLINDPDLILADEPTGNLDPLNAENIGELLFSLSEQFNKTLILVTHDMSLAERGSRVCTIENGCIA